jgi:hypothetical protein
LKVVWRTRDAADGVPTETIVDGAFLCTGPASMESEVCFDLRGKEGYFSSPWPHPSIPTEASVAIVGTGLSAVDAVKQLYASGHKGSVVMASRQGRLPTVKAGAVDPFRPLTVATPEAVSAIVAEKGTGSAGLVETYFGLIKREMTAFNEDFHRGKAVAAAGEGNETDFDAAECNRKFGECFDAAIACSVETDAAATLRAAIAQHKTGDRVPWQDCVIALSIRDVVRLMWSTLGNEEKTTFQSHYTTMMQIYFNSMPVSSAEDVLGFMTDKGCAVRGGLSRVAVSDSGFQLHFSDGSTTAVSHVINATGFGKRINDNTLCMMSPLHRSICGTGLVKASPFGGLSCDFATCKLHTANGDARPLFYGVGHIISGAKLLTSGLSYCLADGACAVSDFVASMKAR